MKLLSSRESPTASSLELHLKNLFGEEVGQVVLRYDFLLEIQLFRFLPTNHSSDKLAKSNIPSYDSMTINKTTRIEVESVYIDSCSLNNSLSKLDKDTTPSYESMTINKAPVRIESAKSNQHSINYSLGKLDNSHTLS